MYRGNCSTSGTYCGSAALFASVADISRNFRGATTHLSASVMHTIKMPCCFALFNKHFLYEPNNIFFIVERYIEWILRRDSKGRFLTYLKIGIK